MPGGYDCGRLLGSAPQENKMRPEAFAARKDDPVDLVQ